MEICRRQERSHVVNEAVRRGVEYAFPRSVDDDVNQIKEFMLECKIKDESPNAQLRINAKKARRWQKCCAEVKNLLAESRNFTVKVERG